MPPLEDEVGVVTKNQGEVLVEDGVAIPQIPLAGKKVNEIKRKGTTRTTVNK